MFPPPRQSLAPDAHTFVLKYRATGVIQQQGSNSTTEWKALFPKRDAPIKRSRITLQLPSTLADRVLSVDTTGAEVTTKKVNATTFIFMRQRSLPPGKALTVQLKLRGNSVTVNADNGSPQTRTQGYTLLTWLYLLVGVAPCIAIAIFAAIRDRCPQCQKLTLQYSSVLAQRPTRRSPGRRESRYACKHCGYHRTNIDTIPPLSSSRSSTSGISGCGGCGGSSGGGGGCGGGGCGGGGCGGGGCGGGG